MLRTQILIPVQMMQQLDIESQKTGVSKSELIRFAITEYLTQKKQEVSSPQ